MYDFIVANTLLILGILGFLAFLVEVIVQMTKELPGIVKMPTKLYVIIVSVVICVLSLFVFGAWQAIAVLWHYVVLAVIGGFVVAYISMYGWDTVKELYDRYKKF